MNKKNTIKIKLLLLTLMPLLALVAISFYTDWQIRQVSTQIQNEAKQEVELLTNYGNKMMGYADMDNTNELLALDQYKIKAFLEKINKSVDWSKTLQQTAFFHVLIFTIMAIFLTLIFNLLITNRIMNRLKQISMVAQRIGQGERNISVSQFKEDEIGSLLRTLCEMQTNIARVENALREKEKHARMITDSVPAMICYVDNNEIYQFCNVHYAKSFNKKPEEVLGKAMGELIGPALYTKIKEHIEKVLSGEDINFELDYISNGVRKYVEGTYLPDKDEFNQIRGFFAIVHDVSKMAIAKIQLEKQQQDLEHLSLTDALTGLFNRRSLVDRIELEMARSQRYNVPFSLLILDLDHFKRVNDTFGHPVGDDVLRHLGKILKNASRETDYVCRFGGEEFSIVLSDTPIEDALGFAERIRFIIEESCMHLTDGKELYFTCSIGCAEHNKGITTSKELIAVADEALYNAKKQGRNRVVVARDRVHS